MGKYLMIWIVVVITLVTSGCAASTSNHDDWLGRDKLYHFMATTAIGAGSSAVARDNGASKAEAVIVGISIAIGVGAAKESYDKWVRRTFWSWKDMFWDVVGGTIGSLIASRYR